MSAPTTTPAPVINAVAPKDRTHRWNELGQLGDPFAGDPAPSEFGYWFNYFWKECKSRLNLTHVEKVKLTEVFESVLEQTAPNTWTARRDLATRDNHFKENALRQLLMIGFKRVALKKPPTVIRARREGKPKLAPPPLTAVEARELNFSTSIASKIGELPIGFRADGRDYETLKRHGGFRPRARSHDSPVYSDYALNMPWHPYNNPVYQNSLFLRLGETNKDNCLHTVISVGARFADITHFPILNDYVLNFETKSADGRFLAVKPFDEWTADDVRRCEAHRLGIQVVRARDGSVQGLQRTNHIYAFHLAGIRGYDTQAHFSGADAFPERGMERVPTCHLLAELEFLQKCYFDLSTDKIQLYELDFQPIRWLPTLEAVESLLGKDGRQKLERAINEEVTRALARADINGEAQKRTAQLPLWPNRLKTHERAQMLAALRQYRSQQKQQFETEQAALPPEKRKKSAPPPNRAKEVAGVKALCPAFAHKLDQFDASSWSLVRKEAGV